MTRSPAEIQGLAAERREARKRSLSTAYLSPAQPWGREPPRFGDLPATASPAQPRTWQEPPSGPIANVLVPAALSPSKGSGVTLTPEEVEKFRAAERAAFAERLSSRWKWNLAHL